MKHNLCIVLIFAGISGMGFSSAASAQQTTAKTAPQQTAKTDPLAADPRLNVKLDFRCQKAKISTIFADLYVYTHVRLESKQDFQNITIRVSDTSLRDILDSIAGLCRCEWKLEDRKWILSGEKRTLSGFHPHNADEAEVLKQGRALLAAIDTLPDDVKQRLTSERPPQITGSDPRTWPSAGVPFSDLPPAMQNMVQAGYAADRRNYTTLHAGASTEGWPESLSQYHVQMLTQDNGDYIGHSVVLISDIKGRGVVLSEGVINFNTLPGPNPDYNIVSDDQCEQEGEDWIAGHYDRLKKSREEALAADKRMNKPITLTMEKVSCVQALQTLARLNHIAIATDTMMPDSYLHTFRFDKTPLHEALDQIAAAYALKLTAWGRWIPAEEEPNVPPIPVNRFVKSVMHVNGKVYNPGPTKPQTLAWGWRKSGVFLFTNISGVERDTYELVEKRKKPVTAQADSKPISAELPVPK